MPVRSMTGLVTVGSDDISARACPSKTGIRKSKALSGVWIQFPPRSTLPRENDRSKEQPFPIARLPLKQCPLKV